ncbi:MAG: hypothetical protein WKG06_10410 [Segetibacter sp.]
MGFTFSCLPFVSHFFWISFIPDERTHLIIRSRDNRRLSDGLKLFEHVAAQPSAGSYNIELVKDIGKGIESRTANVEVRFVK